MKQCLWGAITINSIFHFIIPMGLGYFLKTKWKYGILILIAFELFENLSGYTLIVLNWEIITPEPIINIFADLIIGTVGLFVGYKIRSKNIYVFKSSKHVQ